MNKLAVSAVALLHDVLQVNKTLRVLELDLYPLSDRTPAYMAPREGLDAAFQNEKLHSASLAFASKAAFLSVVRTTKCSALAAVDALIVSLVFQVAVTCVHRMLLWIDLDGEWIAYGGGEDGDIDAIGN